MTEVSQYRKTRLELHFLIKKAQGELAELDMFPVDNFDIGTILQFTQGDELWLARKMDEKTNEGNFLWFDYVGNQLEPYERLFPVNLINLQIATLHPTSIWEAPVAPFENAVPLENTFNGFETKDNI